MLLKVEIKNMKSCFLIYILFLIRFKKSFKIILFILCQVSLVDIYGQTRVLSATIHKQEYLFGLPQMWGVEGCSNKVSSCLTTVSVNN